MSYELSKGTITYRLATDGERLRSLAEVSPAEQRRQAAIAAWNKVGPNPAVMLSGGIDSQFMAACLVEAGCQFQPIIADYEALNEFDVETALRFCELYSLTPDVRSFNIRRFLYRECIPFAIQHEMSSPQFACHAAVLHSFKDEFSGALYGGNAMFKLDGEYVLKMTAAQLLDLHSYSAHYSFPLVSSFLSFSEPLCIGLAVLSKDSELSVDGRYHQKVESYRKHGVDIIPQAQKFTGFERIKDTIDRQQGRPGAFETMFRLPLYAAQPPHEPVTLITEDQRHALDFLSDFYDY